MTMWTSRPLRPFVASLLTVLSLNTQTSADVVRVGDEPWYRQPAADIPRARELFTRAVSHHQQLLRGVARDLYGQALVQWDNPDIRWNLALVLEDLGQYLHAHRELEAAERWGDSLGAERLRDVHKRMAALEAHHLARIEASCVEPATEVTLDGQPWFRGAAHQSTLVEPGEHYVVARKQGFFSVTRSISLTVGRLAQVDLPMDPDRLIETKRWSTWTPWIVVSAGVGLAVVGGVLERQAQLDREHAATSLPVQCVLPAGCKPTSAPSSYSRAVTQHRIAFGAFAAAGAVAATGLLLVWINQSYTLAYRSTARANEKIRILPIITSDQVSISAQRRF